LIYALALFLSAIFAVIAFIHLYWAAGGTFGKSASIPELNNEPYFRPSAAATLGVAIFLFGCSALVLAVAGVMTVPIGPEVLVWTTYLLAAALAIRAIGDFHVVGFFKRVKGSRFARRDTIFYSPLCLGLAIGVCAIALSHPR
jgi:Protein of unknown function (DUF3995)